MCPAAAEATAAVGPVGLELAGLDVVGENDAQDAVEEPALELGVFDREHDLDTAAEVSRHPVGRGQEDLRARRRSGNR